MRILIIEDNQKLAGYIKKALEQSGYTTDCVYNGDEGEVRASNHSYDLIILDLMLPKKDGVSICRDLRNKDVNTPILMLTARDEMDDKVIGLDSGADDYMVKPFDLAELQARIRALLRRPENRIKEILTARDITIQTSSHTVTKEDALISLTLKEYQILEYLIRNKNQTLTRDQLLDHCWDFAFDSFSNIVDVYIKSLRKKIGDKNGPYIKTIRGIGYQFQG